MDDYEDASFDEMIEQFEAAHGWYMGHYNMEGERISMKEWFKLRLEDPYYRRVAQTDVGDYAVSTVLLGTDHNLSGEGPPIIFETMIFDSDGHGVWLDRYPNKVAALAGHDQAVSMVRDGKVSEYDGDC